MAKPVAPLVLSILVVLLAVFFFVGAVGGFLFDGATKATDIGLYSVTVVLLGLGLFGVWAAMIQRKQAQ